VTYVQNTPRTVRQVVRDLGRNERVRQCGRLVKSFLVLFQSSMTGGVEPSGKM